MSALAELIKSALDSNNMSQAELARRMQVSDQIVSYWLGGKRKGAMLKPATVVALAQALKVRDVDVWAAIITDAAGVPVKVERAERDPRRDMLIAAAEGVTEEEVERATAILRQFMDD